MTKKELIEHLKEQYRATEEALYKLGVIKDIKQDTELINLHIQDRFRDALMHLRHESYDKLKDLLERASKQKWV